MNEHSGAFFNTRGYSCVWLQVTISQQHSPCTVHLFEKTLDLGCGSLTIVSSCARTTSCTSRLSPAWNSRSLVNTSDSVIAAIFCHSFWTVISMYFYVCFVGLRNISMWVCLQGWKMSKARLGLSCPPHVDTRQVTTKSWNVMKCDKFEVSWSDVAKISPGLYAKQIEGGTNAQRVDANQIEEHLAAILAVIVPVLGMICHDCPSGWSLFQNIPKKSEKSIGFCELIGTESEKN